MPRDYSFALPKKERKAALRGALSMKQKEGKLILLDDFPLKEFKTREVSDGLKKLQVKDALIVTDEKRPFLERSARNIPKIQVVRYESLNVYDILNHDHLILLAPAAEKIQEVLAS
jgi:large subunit ribosomal protein L4